MDQKQINYIFDKRFCEFAFSSLGRRAQITFHDRSKASGNFYTAHPVSGDFVVKNFNSENEPNHKSDSKIIRTEDFVFFTIENVEKPPIMEEVRGKGRGKGGKEKFQTDGEISGEITSAKKNLVK